MAEISKKSGKTPLENRQVSAEERAMWRPGNRTMVDIDPELQNFFDEKGIVVRWISQKTFYANGNLHKRGWRPYKPESDKEFGSMGVAYGKSPEGYIQRGDLILGYMPKWRFEEHRADVQARTKRQSQVQKQTKAELMKDLERAGVVNEYDDE